MKAIKKATPKRRTTVKRNSNDDSFDRPDDINKTTTHKVKQPKMFNIDDDQMVDDDESDVAGLNLEADEEI
jgi:hypothetical protein